MGWSLKNNKIIGPSGVYINIGSKGLFYRQPELDYAAETVEVSNAASNLKLGKGFVKQINKLRFIYWGVLIASAILFYSLKVFWGTAAICAVGILLWKYLTFNVRVDMDSEIEWEWRKLLETLREMRRSKKVWMVESSSDIANKKINAGATKSVARVKAKIKLLKPNWFNGFNGFRLKLDNQTILIRSRKLMIIFLPNIVLVKKGFRYSAHNYEALRMSSSTTNMVETGSVARDATIIRKTWKNVNADGSADKRFKENKQYPVCMYGLLRIYSEKLYVELQTSNKLVTQNVDGAYRHYTEFLVQLIKNVSLQKNQVKSIKRRPLVEIISDVKQAEKTIEYVTKASSIEKNEKVILYADPYEALFDTEEMNSKKIEERVVEEPDVVDELMGFFEED